LIAATGSYLQARHQQGEWHLRIEDIDPPREMPGATDSILRTLDSYGFQWDGDVIYQSQRLALYQDYLEQLRKDGYTFPCTCSRKEISERMAKTGQRVYPGTCRNKPYPRLSGYAERVIALDKQVEFEDSLQGKMSYHIQSEIGDFVIKRADGLFSYQLAVAVDDGSMGITEVARGCDLLDSTPRQIYLQQLLNLATPGYLHLPVATNVEGQKLSKQSYAPALDTRQTISMLWQVLHILGQSPGAALKQASLDELWRWAIDNWKLSAVPAKPSLIINP
jgi:glutamyl-Q tRNA(Asp) synthetase